jgi:hypothetical protein
MSLLSGCSAIVDNIAYTIDYAVYGPDDTSLTTQQIEQLDYAAQYATVAGQPRSVLILGFVDTSKSKTSPHMTWVSTSNEALVLTNGRLIATHGLTSQFDNIERPIYQLTATQPDPLGCLVTTRQANVDCPTVWQGHVIAGDGAQEKRYQLYGEFERVGTIEYQHANGQSMTLTHWRETLLTRYGNQQWQYDNHYYLEEGKNGKAPRVVESQQQLIPDFPSLHMQELRAYQMSVNEARNEK